MTKKEITICGKQVTLAYNFATELAFFDLTGQDFSTFFASIAAALRDKPVTEENILAAILSIPPMTRIKAIVASIVSYYESTDTEAPVIDRDLMQDASPEDLMTALATVITLHNEWYHLPTSAPATVPDAAASGSTAATVPGAAASGSTEERAPGKN